MICAIEKFLVCITTIHCPLKQQYLKYHANIGVTSLKKEEMFKYDANIAIIHQKLY